METQRRAALATDCRKLVQSARAARALQGTRERATPVDQGVPGRCDSSRRGTAEAHGVRCRRAPSRADEELSQHHRELGRARLGPRQPADGLPRNQGCSCARAAPSRPVVPVHHPRLLWQSNQGPRASYGARRSVLDAAATRSPAGHRRTALPPRVPAHAAHARAVSPRRRAGADRGPALCVPRSGDLVSMDAASTPRASGSGCGAGPTRTREDRVSASRPH